MRLTTHQSVMGRNRKHDIAYGMGAIWLKKIGKYKYELIENAIDKLGELEDIEEELGIDLVTLFKALKQGYIFRKIYLSEKDLGVEKFEIIKQDIDLLNFEESYKSNAVLHCACFGKTEEQGSYKQCYQYLNYLKDYGKTWALTKEELL